jgi:hypothetical protein
MPKSFGLTGMTPLQNGKEELIELSRRLRWSWVRYRDMSDVWCESEAKGLHVYIALGESIIEKDKLTRSLSIDRTHCESTVRGHKGAMGVELMECHIYNF